MIRAFAHDGLTIAVDALEDDLVWLEEFLAPAFQRGSIGDAEIRVEFSASDSSIFEPPDGEPPSAWREGTLSAFALDSGPLVLPAQPIDDGLRLFDRDKPIVFDVTRGGLHTLVRHRDCPLDARARLMRVLREYAHNHSVATGGLMLHAAAIARQGRAVAIAGPKGAGKTTMAVRLLERAGTDFLANDRVLVRGTHPPSALGVPTIISWPERTRPLFPGVTSRLAALGDFREHAAERTPGLHHGMFDGPLWYLSADQLCAVLGQSHAAATPLTALLLLMPPGKPSSPAIRRLETEEAALALRENLLCRRSGRYVSDVFVTTQARAASLGLDERCRSLASSVPCYGVMTSDNAIALVDEHLQDLIDGIVSGHPAP